MIIIKNLIKAINKKDIDSFIKNKDKLMTKNKDDLKKYLNYLNQLDDNNQIRFIDYLYLYDIINTKINE